MEQYYNNTKANLAIQETLNAIRQRAANAKSETHVRVIILEEVSKLSKLLPKTVFIAEKLGERGMVTIDNSVAYLHFYLKGIAQEDFRKDIVSNYGDTFDPEDEMSKYAETIVSLFADIEKFANSKDLQDAVKGLPSDIKNAVLDQLGSALDTNNAKIIRPHVIFELRHDVTLGDDERNAVDELLSIDLRYASESEKNRLEGIYGGLSETLKAGIRADLGILEPELSEEELVATDVLNRIDTNNRAVIEENKTIAQSRGKVGKAAVVGGVAGAVCFVLPVALANYSEKLGLPSIEFGLVEAIQKVAPPSVGSLIEDVRVQFASAAVATLVVAAVVAIIASSMAAAPVERS